MSFIPANIYSASLYRSLELFHDGIMDVRLQDSPEGLQNLVRVRSFKMVVDNNWCKIKASKNFEVTLEK